MGDETWKTASKFMSIETATQLSHRIQEHIQEHNLSEFTLGLHGGEPLLMSPEKLDNLIIALKSQIKNDTKLSFGVQTNGILMTLEHIQVFKKHNVHVSISLDGTESSHDKNRIDLKGLPSWERVIKGIELLQNEAPELFIGLLCVIDIESDPIVCFDYLAKFDVNIDFLLPLNTFDNPPKYPDDDDIAYGKWYYSIYQEWINGRNSHIEVRFIRNILGQLMGGDAIYEVMTANPIGLMTVSTDGGIEGLDCLKSIGNGIQVTNLSIFKTSFTEALDHEIVRMRQIGIDGLNKKCKECDYLYGCAGGYFPNRYSKENGFDNPSVYCKDLYWLLSEIEKDLLKRINKNESTII